MTSTKIFQLEYGTGPGGEDAGDDDQRGERQPGAAPRHVSSRGKDNRIGLENLTLKFSFNYV